MVDTELILKIIAEGFQKVNERFDQVDKQFGQVEARLDKMDTRFEQVEARLDKMDMRFNQVEDQLHQMNEKLDTIDEAVKRLEYSQPDDIIGLLRSIDRKLEYNDDKIQTLNRRLFDVETKVDRLGNQ